MAAKALSPTLTRRVRQSDPPELCDMPGTIVPLPVMLEEEDRKVYEQLKPPKSIVVRYGYMKLVAELPHDGEARPGCGSKLVIRTSRGIEIGEMLTTTCGNAGCGKSISRKQMLEFIENSGGKNYPFTTQGKIVRVATSDDVNEQAHIDSRKTEIIKFAQSMIDELNVSMKMVDVEQLLGGERIIFHYTSDQWVDFRELVRKLASEYQTRIEMHQVNARDEARLVADYERCGQHCCCKQFLKVLKPVSMRSAKVQKATLDPTKISGRCGRLMCCLRYEDETYEQLRKRLPNRQSRVLTENGLGTVVNTQVLTQLVLISLDDNPQPAAYPLENIEVLKKGDPRDVPKPQRPRQTGPPTSAPAARTQRPNKRPTEGEEPPLSADRPGSDLTGDTPSQTAQTAPTDEQPKRKKRRRKRKRRRRKGGDDGNGPATKPGNND